MPKIPLIPHYKSTYWTFECSNKHKHRIDIDYEFTQKEWTFELDAYQFINNGKDAWKIVPVPIKERIECSEFNHALYPKKSRFKKNWTKWEWNWIEKTAKNWNLKRNIETRNRLEDYYKTRSFKCRGIGCRGYGRKQKSWPDWVKPCPNCLQEKSEIINLKTFQKNINLQNG